MKKIRYCEAQIFLDNHLPPEITWRRQSLTSGGSRILLYLDDKIADQAGRYLSEFGREYRGEKNTNEPHYHYIKLTL